MRVMFNLCAYTDRHGIYKVEHLALAIEALGLPRPPAYAEILVGELRIPKAPPNPKAYLTFCEIGFCF